MAPRDEHESTPSAQRALVPHVGGTSSPPPRNRRAPRIRPRQQGAAALSGPRATVGRRPGASELRTGAETERRCHREAMQANPGSFPAKRRDGDEDDDAGATTHAMSGKDHSTKERNDDDAEDDRGRGARPAPVCSGAGESTVRLYPDRRNAPPVPSVPRPRRRSTTFCLSIAWVASSV